MRWMLGILLALWAVAASADGVTNRIGGGGFSRGGGGGGGGCAGVIDLSVGCIVPGVGP